MNIFYNILYEHIYSMYLKNNNNLKKKLQWAKSHIVHIAVY